MNDLDQIKWMIAVFGVGGFVGLVWLAIKIEDIERLFKIVADVVTKREGREETK